MHAIARAGIEAASAGGALSRALAAPVVRRNLTIAPVHVIAAGKAAAAMVERLLGDSELAPRTVIASGTHRRTAFPPPVEWFDGAHPLPNAQSVEAGRRALAVAQGVPPEELLLLLLSGGASALLALPIERVTLADKRRTIELMLHAGADIHALNTVRKHLSAIKGGRLAAACRGRTWTLAVSDVIGDEVTVIGSGPGVADPSTWRDAEAALLRFGGDAHPPNVRTEIARGVMGQVEDTPKPGDARLSRMDAQVIASRTHALNGARDAAEQLGYRVVIFDEAVAGEARVASRIWFDRVLRASRDLQQPLCVVSAGETTVRVTGTGRGGRNQEFVLSLAPTLAASGCDAIAASIGTDGIDGPTDAAGASVDAQTLARAAALGLGSIESYLANNDAFAFFDPLGDLIRFGRTDTNVGDLQICLIQP